MCSKQQQKYDKSTPRRWQIVQRAGDEDQLNGGKARDMYPSPKSVEKRGSKD
jgi:hypothetical protein